MGISEDGYHIWRLKVVDEGGTNYHLQVIDSSSQKQFSNDLRKLALEAYLKKEAHEKKPWDEYWKYKNRYAQVNYAYAMTSHKSQGSTFSNVFVAQNDLCKNQNLIERWRSLYVSYSRTKYRLIINV
jgi:exodeoxyribonuclease-5